MTKIFFLLFLCCTLTNVNGQILWNALDYTVNGALNFFSPIIPESVSSTILNIVKHNILTSQSKIKTITVLSENEYDFIVIGAGTAGAAVANRLSENKTWKILLIEAGGEENLLMQIPINSAASHLTDYNWGYRTEPQQNACFGMKDKRCTWPRGKALGGSSSINGMIHTRGSKEDYDLWASMGNEGWSYDDVLPYFKKSENFQWKESHNDSYHGTDGYVCVQDNVYRSSLSSAFLEAGKELGYEVTDYNGPQQIGFSYLQTNMDHGARCSASKAYLQVDRPNLDILPYAYVTKILINEQKRAYGIVYEKEGVQRVVKARKEIISSGGTIGTAKLLMLSGIGPKDHLNELGIDVIQDLKVGYNMYEHIATWGVMFTFNESVTLNILDVISPVNLLKYVALREGPYSLPTLSEALAFIQTKFAPDPRPDIELLLIDGGIFTDKGFIYKEAYGISDEIYDQFFRPLEYSYACTIWPVVQHPKSFGRLTLRSKDPYDDPILDANFFSDLSDLDTLVEGIKHMIEISKTKAWQKFDAKVYDTKMLGCESYNFGTDDYWKCAIKVLPAMENHEMGTAKMGPKSDANAVVDPQLRVYGINGLRVVDASIMPTMTTGHINAGVYMIGEKGADMIKQTWKNT